MKGTQMHFYRWLTVLFVSALLANPAMAEPPAHAGKAKGKGKSQVQQQVQQPKHMGKPEKGHKGAASHHEGGHHGGGDLDVHVSFGDRHRDIIRDYYGSQFKSGHCPPGLAKKNNGCLPPGQAKKWRVGHPLPGDVIYHDLPHDLVVRLGHDNPAYKLVRVGADILKIGVGSGMVIEAVEDLGGLF